MGIFDNITGWIGHNWAYVLLAILGAYFIYTFFFKKKQSGFEMLDRSAVEYKKYDERMKLNYSFYNWLWYGGNNLGRVEKFRMTDIGEKLPVMEMKIKPILFKIPLINYNVTFLTKAYFIIVNLKNIRRDNKRRELIFTRDVEIYGGSDKFMHIYFDRTLEEPIKDYVRSTMIYKTDLESSLSIWYAKAQEQATMNPEVAFRILMEHLKLEEAKEKRAMASNPGG